MFDYYQAPSDEIFDDMKRVAIHIRETYDDTYWYATEKIDRIKDMENIQDNIWYIYGMFDSSNQQKVKFLVNEDTRSLIFAYDDYNRSFYKTTARERYETLSSKIQQDVRYEYGNYLIDMHWYPRIIAEEIDDWRDEWLEDYYKNM